MHVKMYAYNLHELVCNAMECWMCNDLGPYRKCKQEIEILNNNNSRNIF